jgi:hypothetical protein
MKPPGHDNTAGGPGIKGKLVVNGIRWKGMKRGVFLLVRQAL